MKRKKDLQVEKPEQIPSFLLAEEIADGMGISKEEVGVKVMEYVASACVVENTNMDQGLRERLGLPYWKQTSADTDVVIRTGIRMGVPYDKILDTLKRSWPKS